MSEKRERLVNYKFNDSLLFYFKLIVVIEMKKKLINPLKIGKNLKRCVDQMGYKVKDIQEYLMFRMSSTNLSLV